MGGDHVFVLRDWEISSVTAASICLYLLKIDRVYCILISIKAFTKLLEHIDV